MTAKSYLNMLDTPVLSVLQTAMDYASVRQNALADNIANINTPGYQRKDVSFAAVMAQASAGQPGAALSLAGERSDPRHISFGADPTSGRIDVETDNSGAMRLDGNNVDLDVEMGRLAKNEIYYQGLSQLVAGQFSDLKTAIAPGK